jgi:hypothetical protein
MRASTRRRLFDGLGCKKGRQVTLFLKRPLVCVAVAASLVTPDMATAQRSDDRAQFDARMNMLERSVAELSIQIERLIMSDQELKRKLDAMRTNYDQRLESMEKGAAPERLLPTDPNPEDQRSGSNVIGRPGAPEAPEAAFA